MRCASCRSENPEGAKFCIECAAPLKKHCPSCGVENLPHAKFCAECGTSLAAKQKGQEQTIAPDSQRQTIDSRLAGERRQLTVMFCDLAGSTALSERLDPEELRDVIRAYQHSCAEVIERFGGYIAQYLGDGLLVYFSYPLAHEDDARRAVQAGLEILAALPTLNTRNSHPLQVRIGIHTGPVVVGEVGGGGKREQLALGETPNVAARVQGIAAPDTLVISAATQRLVQGLFVCQDLGAHSLKGISTPLPIYHVLGESGVQNRFEVAVTTGLTPLVGREEEVGLLLRRWEQVKTGHGQVVLLSGEPGIGKSRLVQVLKERIAEEAHTKLEYHCSPFYQNSALYPVIEHMQRLLQCSQEDTPEEKLSKLEITAQRRSGSGTSPYLSSPEMVPLFASLLSIPLPASYPPLTLTPQKQKEKTLDALVTWLLKEAELGPVPALWEDLHWADPSTLEFLSLLIDRVSTARLLLVLTARPEFRPPWALHAHLTQLTLSRLGRTQVEAMVERVTGGKALPAEIVQQVVSKTDGVPLFVEELTKTVVEAMREQVTGDRGPGQEKIVRAHASLPPLGIPATLQDSLVARLDRLHTGKEIAQLGATLGREFSYELLQAVSPVDETSLQHALGTLVEAEVLYQRGLLPQVHYLFKHALIQDAAYQSLLKSKRQHYHQQIAQVLEDRFAETTAAQPELLAHHYTEAGLTAQAIPYWQQAGQRGIQRSAHAEAIGHLTTALGLLITLPDTPERRQHELALQLALGPALIVTQGYAAPEVGKVYGRARELCQQIGETPQLFPMLWGLWYFHFIRAEHQTARELAEQCLTLAQGVQDSALLVQASYALGETLLFLGELPAAREYLAQIITLYDPQQHRSLAVQYGQDPKVASLPWASWTLWHLGYPDQALKSLHEALTFAHELSHPYSLGIALDLAAPLYQFRREEHLAQERAEAAITLGADQGFPYVLALGTICRGWALAEQGQAEEGITQIRESLVAYRNTLAEAGRPYYLALLAEVYGKAGRPEEGLTVVAEALAVIDKTGERLWEAGLYRLKGQLTLQKFPVPGSTFQITNPQAEAEAEAYFHKAIAIARQQKAKSLELRAVMSLARLWQSQGKEDEAREMLAEIYGWFTEGFDTVDLQEAKTMLEELSQ